ncbi:MULTISPECIES: hypothetical protein [Paenalcaligenes]|uniref:DUF1640 domain-containing protein n=1 Tax=Paenalcaligenes hermetiae TaxID=1157987 RepID=A0ABP9M9B1_9BURK|nr:hypothetical protein [Paenalcaligenes sp.]
MSKSAEEIINAVFSQSGLKLEPDDPLVALLLFIDRQYEQQRTLLEDHENAFLLNLDQRLQQVHEVYEALEQQKQHIRLDLITHTQRLVRKEVAEQGRELYKHSLRWVAFGFVLMFLLQVFILARTL